MSSPDNGGLLREFPGETKGGEDPLFPKTTASKSGWAAIDQAQRKELTSFAQQYLKFAGGARTERQAASTLLSLAQMAGAMPLDSTAKVAPGQFYFWQDSATSSIALLRVGSEAIDSGLRVLVTSIDAGEIRLTPTPVYEKSGLALFDTTFLGKMEIETWLNTPLALHIYLAPKKSGGKAISIIIGDQSDEPVFTIPDLLPHLSRKVQRTKLVDSPERMDAVVGFQAKVVASELRKRGLQTRDFERAEATLVPAEPPTFVGVDHGLLAAPNHFGRAIPFAATRALLQGEIPKYSSLLIFTGHNRRSYAGADPDSHVANLIPLVVQKHDPSKDLLDVQRIISRSKVLYFDNHKGKRNVGIVLNTRKDDATPQAFRFVLELFRDAGVPIQVAEESGWSQAREVSSLDMDTVEFGLPIAGLGTPYELLSSLDLYYALQACRVWVSQ